MRPEQCLLSLRRAATLHSVLRTTRYTKHQQSGKSSCGAPPRTSPAAGGPPAADSDDPCAPLQPSPDEHHCLPASFLEPAEGSRRSCTIFPRDVAASHNGVTGNWQQAERRDEKKKSNVCAPATPHRLNGIPRVPSAKAQMRRTLYSVTSLKRYQLLVPRVGI